MQLVLLSRRTNELQRRAQQAQCNGSRPTTDTGAWCPIAVRSLHIVDDRLAARLAELFSGKTVLSLGEGRGDYRRMVLNASSQVEPITTGVRVITLVSNVFLETAFL